MANKHISKHLDKLLNSRVKLLSLNLSPSDKYIFFSDLHRGQGDIADDFKKMNQQSYYAALLHYDKKKFNLVLLGDIEELEEQQKIEKVMPKQLQALHLEKRFYDNRALIKIFGNHDDKWEKNKNVVDHLYEYFPDIIVYEGILLTREDDTKILVVHGHQGAVGSDILPWLEVFLPVSRWWMNLRGKNRINEYKDLCMVGKREQHLYDWVAMQEDMILICGHTHRPVWGGMTHAEKLRKDIAVLREKIESVGEENGVALSAVIANPKEYNVLDKVIKLKKNIQDHNKKVAENGMCNLTDKPLPLYFNTGCCIFSDGDITGIEIEGEQLRLIKWSYNGGTPLRIVLEEGKLDDFLK